MTSDDRFWPITQEAAARAHQLELDFRNWCDENLSRGPLSASMVADEILENWKVVPK
jgi:hypothetical protein